jgi:hypothetical protein
MAGVFDLNQTGTTRYDLLEDFFDISNTTGAQSPGHMNIYPFAQTFVDPPPESGYHWRNWGTLALAAAEGYYLHFPRLS